MPNFPSVIPQFQVIDPIATYGCAFDHRVVFDGATTGATGIITSATANFTTQDIGKRIVLTGAGAGTSPNTAQYVGTISSLNSSSSVNVTPNTTTTVSTKGLQIHTDDLTAWTNLITDLNNAAYPGAVIFMREAWTATGFTNRSGVSAFLPAINKQIQIFGIAGGHTADVGDYTKVGGSCLAYVGTTVDSGQSFGALMTIQPAVGATNQALKQITVSHFWFDCRNGDGPAAIKGLSIKSCHGWNLDDVFIMDAGAVAYEFGVVGPSLPVGNAGSLGEAKDCTRGRAINVSARCLEAPAIGVTSTPTTTTSAITFSTSGQSLVLAAANGLTTSGYVWVETTLGIPVLVNYTGGGGTTTLTGCTVSAQDAAVAAYTTVSGSNVVQAFPGNACIFMLDGDGYSNTCLNHLDTIVISHGSTWGPAAMEFRNCDSMDVQNLVINGGSNAATNAINRVTKPGVRLNGHSNAVYHARNNLFHGGTAGIGGVSHMGVNNAGTILTPQAQANYWEDYQMANGEPLPTVEGHSFFSWNPNGGMSVGALGSTVAVGTAGQAISAATSTLITGTVVAIPPQGIQIGTTLIWTIHLSKAAVGTAARTFFIRFGTTGTTSDTAIATITSALGTAAADNGVFVFTLTIVGPLGASCAARAEMWMTHNLAATGLCTLPSEVLVSGSGVAMATFNSATIQPFFSLSVTTGTAETLTIWQAQVECSKPANP